MENEQKIYGLRAILEAIASEKEIDKVFIQKNLDGELIHELINKAGSNNITVSYVPVEKLNKLTQGNHQGAVAMIAPISFYTLEDLVETSIAKTENPLFLLLDQLSDVRNFGAIIRTAECTGVSGIIIQKKGGAPVNADTVKTSAGAIFNIPIAKVDHIKDAIYYLQSSGIKTIAATEKSNQLIYDISLQSGCAIIMGSEGRGINPSVIKIADETAKLPIVGEIDSLNVSVACGVFLYEALRQRL